MTYDKNTPKAVKLAANAAVHDAVAKGALIRSPCERCGEPKSEGHHDDYSKPLEVRWLCRQHHAEVHREIGRPLGRQRRLAEISSAIVCLRATSNERGQWRAAAESEDKTLSQWARGSINEECDIIEQAEWLRDFTDDIDLQLACDRVLGLDSLDECDKDEREGIIETSREMVLATLNRAARRAERSRR